MSKDFRLSAATILQPGLRWSRT